MKAFTLVLLLGASLTQAAEPYKWRDSEGNVHYSDQPPPRGAKAVERPSLKGNRIESDTLPFETRMLAKKYPVTLYAFAECGAACEEGRALLLRRGIPFTLMSRDEDKLTLQKLTGDNTVPVLTVGHQPPLKGYEASQWNELLDLAGYPASNPLGNLKKSPKAASVEKD